MTASLQATALHKIIVFAGPSLPEHPDATWRRRLDDVDLRPPAQRGDLLAALSERPTVIVLLDGYYYSKPAISHKEILYALDSGVRVIGAASMGALRAAELERYGMIGVGRVFRDFREGRLDGDDEVALLHLPASHGYRAVTLALVELRHAVTERVEAGSIEAPSGERLIATVKALPFHERYPETVEARIRTELDDDAARRLIDHLAHLRLKEDDAAAALDLAARPTTPTVPRRHRATVPFDRFRELHVRSGDRRYRDVGLAIQVLHPEAETVIEAIHLRFLLASAARLEGLAVEERALTERAERIGKELAGKGCPLPALECLEEAELDLLAEAVRHDPRTGDQPLEDLASKMGLASGSQSERRLLDVVISDPLMVTDWQITRALLRTEAVRAATHTVDAAHEVYACFRHRVGSQRITQAQLTDLAMSLWTPGSVDQQASRRGLGHASRRSFRDALERFAPAELLPQAINTYPQHKAALLATRLEWERSTGARS
ncbi:MAG: TfuA-like protein [Acidobacteriota bacterium]